jgi:hypothetical protein
MSQRARPAADQTVYQPEAAEHGLLPTTSPSQIQHLAKVWLQEEDLLELVVGKY